MTMGLVEQSKNAGEVLAGSAIVEARMRLAQLRLEVDIVAELARLGADTSAAAVRKIIDGLPEDALYRELARRT